jgi:WD40 repeat protein
VAASRDGRVITAAEDGALLLWPRFDGPRARPVVLGAARRGRPSSLAISPDGRWGAVGIANVQPYSDFELWDLAGRRVEAHEQVVGIINSLDFSSDSARLAAAIDGKITTMELVGTPRFEFAVSAELPPASCVAFSSHDSQTVIIGHVTTASRRGTFHCTDCSGRKSGIGSPLRRLSGRTARERSPFWAASTASCAGAICAPGRSRWR